MGIAELVVVLICVVASFIAGLCGMGAFMISIPVMAMFLPIHTVVLACSMAGPGLSLMLFVRYGRQCRWRSLLPMLAGAIPGAIVGVFILKIVEGRVLQLILGLVMLAFLAWQQWGSIERGQESWQKGGLTGFISGILGTSISVDGAPVAAYALYAGWEPKSFLGTLSAYYLCRGIISCAAQASAGLYDLGIARVAAYVLAGCLVGTLLSFPVLDRFRVTTFRNMVKAVMLFAALSSLWNARSLFGVP